MQTLDVDLASASKKTATCRIEWRDGAAREGWIVLPAADAVRRLPAG